MIDRAKTTPFITPRDMAKAVNLNAGVDVVRWNSEFECFETVGGDRYCSGDIEDVMRGILRNKANGKEWVPEPMPDGVRDDDGD